MSVLLVLAAIFSFVALLFVVSCAMAAIMKPQSHWFSKCLALVGFISAFLTYMVLLLSTLTSPEELPLGLVSSLKAEDVVLDEELETKLEAMEYGDRVKVQPDLIVILQESGYYLVRGEELYAQEVD